MRYLKQSTATYVQLGPFLDEDDGKTAETGLTISQADVRVSKAGAAFAQKTDSNAATHDENGWYRCQLDATDTGTVGRLIVAVHESGALPVWVEFTVLSANVYDSLVAATDELQVDTLDIADDLLKRDVDNVETTAPVHSLAGVVLKNMSRVDASGGSNVITYETDGSTTFSTQAISDSESGPDIITEQGVAS